MALVETTYQGWFSRIGGAIVGLFLGLLLFVLSFPLLFWNEGRAVHTARTLEQGQSAVLPVDSTRVDPANEGKLVHFTGLAINATGGKVTDPIFHVSRDAIHLRREVLMYQWKEDRKTTSRNDTIGGGQTQTTTYSYSQVWGNEPIDSSSFKEAGHANPAHWRIESETQDAPSVTAGAFTLDRSLAGKIDNFTPVELSTDTADWLDSRSKPDAVSSNAVFLSNDSQGKANPDSPQIGDLKITFKAALPGDVSVIAMQTGSSVAPYQPRENALELLYVGDHSAAEMFKSETQKNTILTWILRGVGFVIMWIGLLLMLNPLRILSDVVGIIGQIVGAGIGLISGVTAIALSLVTVAIAWLSYRPILGIGLLVVAGGAIVGFIVLRAKGATPNQAGGAVTAGK